MAADSKTRAKKIAVIAVHGVGDQAPFDTAHRIGDLLQSLDANRQPGEAPPLRDSYPHPEQPTYYPFHEEAIRIDVRPTVVVPEEESSAQSNARGPFDAWVKKIFRDRVKDVDDEDIWYRFIRGQLAFYHGEEPENTYGTIRMEGRRAHPDPSQQCDVHIYELYWADLSRLTAGVFSIFTELYQVLFHLPSLATHTVNASASHHSDSGRWRTYKWLQSASANILALAIPVLNLFMAGVLAVILGLGVVGPLPLVQQISILIGVSAVLVVAGLGAILWNLLARHKLNAIVWIAPLGVGIAAVVVAFLSNLKNWNSPTGVQILESVLIAAIVVIVLLVVLNAYNLRRPGSFLRGIILMAVVVIVSFASQCYSSPDPVDHGAPSLISSQADSGTATAKQPTSLLQSHVVMFWVRLFEIGDIFVGVTWGLFFVFAFITVVFGFFTASGSEVTRRSWWTAVLTTSLPTLALLIVTTALWYAIAFASLRFLPDTAYFPLLRFQTLCVTDMAHVVMADLEVILGILLPCAGAALIPAIWGLAPVVWTEVFAPSPTPHTLGDLSRRLGRWLTFAFAGLSLSGFVLYVGTMIGLPLLAAVYVVDPSMPLLNRLHGGIGLFSSLTGVGLSVMILLRGRLKSLALGFRSTLDMLLDVDNWLREHPRDSNPKARICGRYVSLLRYIANWKDHAGGDPSNPEMDPGYDGIVIIAHSQGTVITADMLRFLKREAANVGGIEKYDPEIAPLQNIPIAFFTMGCPLRQLYGLRFPNLYHWARHSDINPISKWQARDIPANQAPDPSKLLSVKEWINCYRSGDYVGRYLWRTDTCDYAWDGDCCGHPMSKPMQYNSTDGKMRAEFCIGAGAHTHYWDSTAQIVAEELDRLIASVA